MNVGSKVFRTNAENKASVLVASREDKALRVNVGVSVLVVSKENKVFRVNAENKALRW